jgi:Fic family protein
MKRISQRDRERQIQRAVASHELGVPFTVADVVSLLGWTRSTANQALRKALANGVVKLDYEGGGWPRTSTNLWRPGDSLAGTVPADEVE